MLDLLVIGAGLSGLTAALIAAEAGLRVRVVAKGLNALHWSPGTLDLLGYLPEQDDPRVDQPFTGLGHLPADHPLRRIAPDTIRAAYQRVQGWLAAASLPYVGGDADANLWLPSPAGAARPTYLAPAAQAAGRLDDATPFLVVGFEKLRDFYPRLIAENLIRQGQRARAATLPFSCVTIREDGNTLHLAQSLDDPAQVQVLGRALAKIVQPGERIALPAICGFARHPEVMAELAAMTGAPVAEIPTLPPSVPGVRLHHALVARLQRLGVRVEVNMTVIGFATHPGTQTIRGVQTATTARPLEHRAGAYLLATGGILGGGLNSDHQGRIWETAFNLPVAVPDRDQWFRPEFLDPRGHPVFAGGVAVDANWQPVDAARAPVYTNLWAAGSILAHADSIRTRSREGLALATGAAAVASLLAQQNPLPAVGEGVDHP